MIMKEISLAILAIGLCFYNAYLYRLGREADALAAFVAFVAAILLFTA